MNIWHAGQEESNTDGQSLLQAGPLIYIYSNLTLQNLINFLFYQ